MPIPQDSMEAIRAVTAPLDPGPAPTPALIRADGLSKYASIAADASGMKWRRNPRAGSRLEVRRGGPFRKQHVCLLRTDALRRQFARCKRARHLIDQSFRRKSNALTFLL